MTPERLAEIADSTAYECPYLDELIAAIRERDERIAKLREQREWWKAIAARHGYHGPDGDDAELAALEGK